MLIGLAAKNAILIVEFAKSGIREGQDASIDAALTGARLRLRPILMTSFAFILGCVPLWFATGAGAVCPPHPGHRRHRRHAGGHGHRHFPDPGHILRGRTPDAPRQAVGGREDTVSQGGRGACMTRPLRSLLTLSLGLVLAGCTVGPRYQRPVIDAPQAYRGPAEEAAQPAPASLGDAKWWTVFQDPQLQELIRVALQQNFDVRIAATRVLQAQAQVGITRADQFPSVNAGADYTAQRLAKTSSILPAFETNTGELDLSVLWNLDFWGKYRKATEAARASLLASEWGRRAVLDSVISNVATAYFQLRAMDLQLEISKDTLASRQDSLRLTQVLARNGSASRSRRPPGRATGLHRIGNDPRSGAPDSAARKSHQHSPRQESRSCRSRPSNHRRTKTAERSAGPSLRASRAPS